MATCLSPSPWLAVDYGRRTSYCCQYVALLRSPKGVILCSAIDTTNGQEEPWIFVSKAAAQPEPLHHYLVHGSTAVAGQQQRRHGTRAQALAFVPKVTAYGCTVGAQQQEIELRQYFRALCNNQTHIVGPHTRYTKHTAAAKTIAHSYRRNACVPHTSIRLATPPGYQFNPTPKGILY